MKFRENNALSEFGSALGKGLLAGLAATAVMTLSQIIEMKITERKPSEAPLKVAKETVSVKPVNEEEKEKVSTEIHWAYGTSWGIARGLISLTGLKGVPATLVHFATVWGASMIMLRYFKAAPPVTEEDNKTIAIDGLHHAVYAITAGIVFDTLDVNHKYEVKINKIVKLLKLKGLS